MTILFWLAIIATVVAIYVIRYIVSKAVHSGTDAVANAYKRKKNQQNSDTSENLSDRYK